jgi:hypothetical protein
LKFILLLALIMAACGVASPPGKPDLPASISPGWKMKTYAAAPPPEGLPDGFKPVCWKADYEGSGNAVAEVWICGYAVSAFEPMQRARAAANTVKFYKGRYLILVRWNGGTRTDVTALMRGLENALT